MNINDYFSSTLNLFNKTGFSSPASLQVRFKQQELYSARQLLGITARNWVLLSEKGEWLGRELESQLQLIQEETLLFYMHLLETRARKKGHLLPVKTWDFLSGLLEPDLFRLPHTHLPFSLLHIHTSVYIKYFQSFHLLGTQWYFGSRGSCWSCPQWWCTASACCPSHNKGLWLPGIPYMCKDKRLKPFKTV